MKIYLRKSCIPLSVALMLAGCTNVSEMTDIRTEWPTTNHDLSYIPYNEKLDRNDYNICDSTKMGSGRSRVKYTGGLERLTNDLHSTYQPEDRYGSFTGYIVVRFLMNCHGETGRYRAESIDLDFSPLIASEGMVDHVLKLVRELENWTVSNNYKGNEYSKYVNIKFEDGKIQNVIM